MMKQMRKTIEILVLSILIPLTVAAQAPSGPGVAKTANDVPNAEAAAIRQAALDYIEGYYDGSAERMERALHPELAKRIVHTDAKTGRSRLDQMGAMTLVQITRGRSGRTVPGPQQKDVTILDVFGGAASAKIVANDWIDYLHLAKFNGRWVIVNVLWEMKAEKK
jgi:hypothetical protein